MKVAVSLETGSNNSQFAFAFELPGTCGWGRSTVEALNKLRADYTWTCRWLNANGFTNNSNVEIEFIIVDQVKSGGNPLDADTEGFFEYDKHVYTGQEVENTRDILTLCRAHLLDLIEDIAPADFEFRPVEGKRTLTEILDHIASAEWWYMTRISQIAIEMDDWRKLATDSRAKLCQVRQMTYDYFTKLSDVEQRDRLYVQELNGETWSYRKILRRMVWHELLHIKQIERLKPKLQSGGLR